MDPMYSVPLIPQNLRSEETIVQIADSLKYLSEITNDILKRINTRIVDNQLHLQNVSDRISAANSKVEKLRGAKKAIQVFSSSKYPATDIKTKYISIFNGEKVVLKRSKIEYAEMYPSYQPLEKLQFYHVKIQSNKIDASKQGLGEVANNIESVNDMLLYNTGKNPYKHYVMSDTLKLIYRSKEENSSLASDIGAAPFSISEHPIQNAKHMGGSYFYSPDLGEVPTIDVPLDLPDLPGIADDLRYISEMGPGIAPSVTTTPIIPDLPLINVAIIEDLALPETPPVVMLTPPLVVTEMPVLPTVPDPPSELLQAIVKEETFTKHDKQKSEGPIRKLPKNEPDVRASLMEAIRNAGGSGKAKLKSTDANISEQQVSTSKSGGDLMADLHAKLLMRRKGISGAKNIESGIDSGSTLSKISSMIPPPPMTAETTDPNTEDDDWD